MQRRASDMLSFIPRIFRILPVLLGVPIPHNGKRCTVAEITGLRTQPPLRLQRVERVCAEEVADPRSTPEAFVR